MKESNTKQLNISLLPAGMYFLCVGEKTSIHLKL